MKRCLKSSYEPKLARQYTGISGKPFISGGSCINKIDIKLALKRLIAFIVNKSTRMKE